MKSSHTRKRERDTKKHILEGALAAFLRHGTGGARMHAIATEAGVSQVLLHYYFRSRAQLADAVFELAVSQLIPELIEVLVSDSSIEEKVADVVELEIDRLSRMPYLASGSRQLFNNPLVSIPGLPQSGVSPDQPLERALMQQHVVVPGGNNQMYPAQVTLGQNLHSQIAVSLAGRHEL